MNTIDFNKYARDIHAHNVKVGWWNPPQDCIYQKLQLVSTEIAEATEGDRKDSMDDKLPHRKMEEVELADALIRVLDIGGRLDISYEKGGWLTNSLVVASNSTGMQHLGLNFDLVDLASGLLSDVPYITLQGCYSRLVDSIVTVAENKGYDIEDAMNEKRHFNSTRPDHKLENRNKPHGKTY